MMDEKLASGTFSIRPIETLNRMSAVEPRAVRPRPPSDLREEILPFTVRLVRNEKDLSKAVQIRYSAYARHVPDFAETLKVAESNDSEDGVAVLLAESKLDGSPLGTMRIQTNQHKPLTLEKSLTLPKWLHESSLAEATRLAVVNEKTGRLVKTALFKAYFQFCQNEGIEWKVITARSPIDRQYDRLLFDDVYPGLGYVPMSHVNNLPHRVMSFEVSTARARWDAAKHPLFDFVFMTYHPDIDVVWNAVNTSSPYLLKADYTSFNRAI